MRISLLRPTEEREIGIWLRHSQCSKENLKELRSHGLNRTAKIFELQLKRWNFIINREANCGFLADKTTVRSFSFDATIPLYVMDFSCRLCLGSACLGWTGWSPEDRWLRWRVRWWHTCKVKEIVVKGDPPPCIIGCSDLNNAIFLKVRKVQNKILQPVNKIKNFKYFTL